MLYVLHTVSPAELGSEDSVLAYAAAAIALAAGMYVAVPVAGVWYLARRRL